MKQQFGRMMLGLLIALLCFGALAEAPENRIAFDDLTVTANSDAVAVEEGRVTITKPGTYTLAGKWTQGQLVVDSDGDVILVLDAVEITSADGPALDIRDADQVTITLVEGTKSVLTDAAEYRNASDGQDAALFTKADLVINGQGGLTVNGMHSDGIASRDTLTIQSGSIAVQAVKHGIKGKDYLLIEGGAIAVTAGGDAIKSTNGAQSRLGYVEITGGTLGLTAGDDGISAESNISVAEATIAIDTKNNGMKAKGSISITSGVLQINYGDDDFVCESKAVSPDVTVSLTKIK